MAEIQQSDHFPFGSQRGLIEETELDLGRIWVGRENMGMGKGRYLGNRAKV